MAFRRDTNKRYSGGYSLVELLIAITFLSIALLSVAGLQGRAISANAVANRLSLASSVAQQVLEELSSRPQEDPIFHNSLSNISYNFNPDRTQPPVFNLQMPAGMGAGTFTAQYWTQPNTPTVGVTQVRVQVAGDAITGRNVNLTTYVRTN